MKLTDIRGISEKREKDLNKLNIFTPEDLVRDFPRAYLDLTQQQKISSCYHNDVALVACRVVSPPQAVYAGRRPFVKVWCEQEGERFSAIWFNAPYVKQHLRAGEEYLFYGRVSNRWGTGVPSMVNPSFEPRERSVRLKGIVPVYSLKGTLTQRAVRDAVREALRFVPIASAIPPSLARRYALTPLGEAYRRIHAPASQEEIAEASARIALEEYFLLITAFRCCKGGKEEARAFRYTCTEADMAAFTARFPFPFTEGQKKAVREIMADCGGPHRMNRLLQGDVGCGKTAVALCGVYMAAKSGLQAAMIAPTEVLAAQNFELARRYLPEYNVVFLAGSTPAKEKREIKRALAAGEAAVVCGTHAVLQEDVQPASLAFCVCDEQHRFGVAQRSALSEKGDSPDMLVMSATPIPRTLSLVFYGDLDVTTIPDKPLDRQPVTTAIIPARKYDDMLAYIRDACRQGGQAYFVCAKIDDDEGEVTSVTELFEELRARLPEVKFALLHGRMKEREKTEVMAAFKHREYDCLVSTTVIEVGVDVPSATIMVIMNAERFGLSQLHQLRGRVGRGSEKSWCFLLVGADTPAARERLTVFRNTSDGFALAEKDLEIRGSGDFLGTRQSGKFLTDVKNLKYSTQVIFTAKKLTDEAFERRLGLDAVKKAAMQKYESLKDIVLN